MKKGLLALLFGLMAMFLIACGGDGDSGEEATDSASAGDDIENATELSMWTFVELHMEFFMDAADRWNEENPDNPIKLTAETYPYDQMHNNLLLALQSGTGAPDIADIEIGRFPNFLEGEPQLLPMNEYVEPELENFVESRFEIYSKDGNYYGMPTHVGASVMYYNTEILDEAGVDPDTIVTWDDFIEAGKKVVENTDSMMFNVHTDDYLPIWQMMTQQESDFFSPDGELTANAPENVETLQMLHDMMFEHGIAELSPGGAPHAEEFYQYMNEGGAAAVTMPAWYMGRFTDYMTDLEGKVIVRPLPAFEEGGNRSAGMGGTGTVVTNQTEEEELAKEFLAFAKLSKDANIKLWTVLGFDPPRHDVWDDPKVLEDNKFFQFFGDDIFDTLDDIKDEIYPVNITEYTPDVATEMNTNVLNNVFRQETATPQEALDQMQETIEGNMQ
ncbi:ABC transporter substrate-binding protein [Saliterribacillus persicus]|uniref:Arabinosaccharide transport system substrate-binding protein n=1 Tax=Saliterribacillus persicus TaxID=930114 RepID=A0A368Y9G1_9BACI|nr:ABC transporter substrate-binding protein [Saliterribacillus persicus]RCW76745.1 arabinosaccharide transport system substrate-binding protein [Saliterribacillus persicus]